MGIQGIDHVNIGTARLEETVSFFRDVLGLTEGWRPDFPFPGAWLYAGSKAVVHLVGLGTERGPTAEAALDHFAFSIDSYDEVLERLQSKGVAYREVRVPTSSIRQIFVQDVNGVAIELNYRPEANPGAGAR